MHVQQAEATVCVLLPFRLRLQWHVLRLRGPDPQPERVADRQGRGTSGGPAEQSGSGASNRSSRSFICASQAAFHNGSFPCTSHSHCHSKPPHPTSSTLFFSSSSTFVSTLNVSGFSSFAKYNIANLHAERGDIVTTAPTSNQQNIDSKKHIHMEQKVWSKLFDAQLAADNPEGSSNWQGSAWPELGGN